MSSAIEASSWSSSSLRIWLMINRSFPPTTFAIASSSLAGAFKPGLYSRPELRPKVYSRVSSSVASILSKAFLSGSASLPIPEIFLSVPCPTNIARLGASPCVATFCSQTSRFSTAGLSPSCPSVMVVTPMAKKFSKSGVSSGLPCECKSINPGEITRPFASIVRVILERRSCFENRVSPTKTIESSTITTSALMASLPNPSSTCPLVITRSMRVCSGRKG